MNILTLSLTERTEIFYENRGKKVVGSTFFFVKWQDKAERCRRKWRLSISIEYKNIEEAGSSCMFASRKPVENELKELVMTNRRGFSNKLNWLYKMWKRERNMSWGR